MEAGDDRSRVLDRRTSRLSSDVTELAESAVDPMDATLTSTGRDSGAIREIVVKYWPNTLVLTLLAAVGVSLVALSGCTSSGGARSSYAQPPAVPAAAPSAAPGSVQPVAAASSRATSPEWAQGRFEDVPVPPGFSLDQNSSFTFVQGSLRQADLRYAGSEPVARVVRFYQETMPNSGWTFLRLTGVQMKTITYLKNDEVCEVIVESHDESRPAPAPAPAPAPQWQGTRFDDVPIPSSFTLDYDASYINISGSGRHPRVADIRYTGETPLSDALSNVQQGMLGSGWSLVSISGVDIKSLRFLKASEECQIIVRSDHDDTTVIIVRLYPRD